MRLQVIHFTVDATDPVQGFGPHAFEPVASVHPKGFDPRCEFSLALHPPHGASRSSRPDWIKNSPSTIAPSAPSSRRSAS
jgi:hypothetical protein